MEETLENLFDFFEHLGDEENVHADFDVTYSVSELCEHTYMYVFTNPSVNSEKNYSGALFLLNLCRQFP